MIHNISKTIKTLPLSTKNELKFHGYIALAMISFIIIMVLGVYVFDKLDIQYENELLECQQNHSIEVCKHELN